MAKDGLWPTDEGRLLELPASNRPVRDKVLNVSKVAPSSSTRAPALGQELTFAKGGFRAAYMLIGIASKLRS